MPPAWEQAIVEILTNILQSIGWGGVTIIMILESANIPIPSEITMPLAGWLLIQANGGTWLHAILLGGFWGGLACTIGSVLSYGLGYYGGRPFVERYGRYIMVTSADLEKADHWFARWGDWASFISRLLPIVRTFISFPAGVARIRFWSFALLTFVGSFVWCGALALGGWYFGQNWEELRAILRPFDIPIAIVMGAGLAYYIYRHVTHGLRGAREEAAGSPAGARPPEA